MLVYAKSDTSVSSLANNFAYLVILKEAFCDGFYFLDVIWSLACVDSLVATYAKQSVLCGYRRC